MFVSHVRKSIEQREKIPEIFDPSDVELLTITFDDIIEDNESLFDIESGTKFNVVKIAIGIGGFYGIFEI